MSTKFGQHIRILTPRIRYSCCYCYSVTEKPDVMVLAPVMVLAYVMVDKEANMVADMVADEMAAMEVDKMAIFLDFLVIFFWISW